ncbi:MAG: hypothetical protein NVSMB19_24780 [Vulcanimicrobiaceae bacterium]
MNVRHAGQSRLAFRMPSTIDAIDFSTAGVLAAMNAWPLAVVTFYEPLEDSVAAALDDNIARLAALLPAHHTARATHVAQSAGRRASSTLQGKLSQSALNAAVRTLHSEIANAAGNLQLDAPESDALRLQGEFAFAAGLIEAATTSDSIDDVVSALPGLFRFYSPHEPAQSLTAIELPYRLVQSPPSDAAFSHALLPVTRATRTELWHTRLGRHAGARAVDATEADVALAAVWSPDYGYPDVVEPGVESSLEPRDRDNIVRLTADQTSDVFGTSRRFRPVPARAHRLMLTALGGWLDVDGHWGPSLPIDAKERKVDLVAWKHRTALGRDWYVETVRIGRLLPLGHRAVHITIVERRFQDAPAGLGRIAVLRKKRYVEVYEPIRSYPGDQQQHDGIDFPFATVEIITKRTPNLEDPGKDESFWPRVHEPVSAYVRFEIRAVDIGGRVSRFDLPLQFVADANLGDSATYIKAYNALPFADERVTAAFRAQTVQLAPGAARVDALGRPDPGDVVYPLQDVHFGAAPPAVPRAKASPEPTFFPYLRTFQVVSTALAQLNGNTGPALMEFAPVYRAHGFGDANKTEVLLSASTAAPPLQTDFATRGNSDKAGGIVTPEFGVSGTSRKFGLIGGDADLLGRTGSFDPKAFFPHAKLFGAIDLAGLLAPFAVALPGVIPIFTTVRTKEKIETTFTVTWEKLSNLPLILVNQRGNSSVFTVRATATSYLQVGEGSSGKIGSGPGAAPALAGVKAPDASGEGKLTWFKFSFFGAIMINFDSFSFKYSKNAGPDVDPQIAKTDGVVFGGPLAFVDTLRHALSGNDDGKSKGGDGKKKPGDGSGSGGGGIPGFKVTPIFKPTLKDITVGVRLGITEIPVGIFVMKNLMVSTAVKLPFEAKPLSIEFGFAERANPFQLTVSCFGGGGFLLIGLDTRDSAINEIEAALEFGAFAEFKPAGGLASGSVYVKAGIYMYYNKPERQTTLKGYVEMGGEVQVIGILSVSILMHLSLGYYKVGPVSEVRGQATLVIAVEILFFSASVNLTVERRFGGTEADPTFKDFYPASALWTTYADAFA